MFKKILNYLHGRKLLLISAGALGIVAFLSMPKWVTLVLVFTIILIILAKKIK